MTCEMRALSRTSEPLCMQFQAVAAKTGVHTFDLEAPQHESRMKKSDDMAMPIVHDYVPHFKWTPMGKIRVRDAQAWDEAALLGVIPFFNQENGRVR